MQHALSSLIHDHRVMSRLVDALRGYAALLEHSEDAHPDPADLGYFARCFRELADDLHHDKEENILIPILAWNGFAWDEGVLADVRRDHAQEQYLIDVICQASQRDSAWSRDERRAIAATARELADFQRQHFTRENDELFPEVLRRLPCAVLERLERQLERFDDHPRHRAQRLELTALAEELVLRYAPQLSNAA